MIEAHQAISKEELRLLDIAAVTVFPELRSTPYWEAKDEYDIEAVKAEDFNNFNLLMPGSSHRERMLTGYSNDLIGDKRSNSSSGLSKTWFELFQDIDQVIIDLNIPIHIVEQLHDTSAPPKETLDDEFFHRVLYLVYDRMRSIGYLAADLA